MPESKKLNQQQQAAVTHKTGPLLIIAGAGTGKTTVITHRVKHLIDSALARPDQILAITFTEKAASEMETRLDELLPMGVTQVTVSTFHSVCDRILRDDGFHAGLPQNYTLVTPAESLGLVKKHLFDFELDYFRPLATPDRFLVSLLTHCDRLRDEDVSPDHYLAWASKQPAKTEEVRLEKAKNLELADFYTQYQALKLKNNVLDFADLIYYSLYLFRSRPNILAAYRRRWPWVLVDEYQDTNYSQTQLVKLLAGDTPNLTVVGDDDQAIYRWRGAATSNILQFTKDYPKSQRVILTQNFRSRQIILDRAYTLIRHNDPDRLEVQAGVDKKLIAVKRGSSQTAVNFLRFPNSEAEADGLVAEITRLKKLHSSLVWSDFAILIRANSTAAPIVKSLTRNGIPHQFLGPSRLFDRPEIKDLIAYLRLLADITDEAALFRVLASDWSGLTGTQVADLLSASRQRRIPLMDILRSVSSEPVKSLLSIFDDHRSRISTTGAGQLLYDLLEKTNWLSHLIHYDTPDDEEVAQNIIRLFNKLKSYEQSHSDPSVPIVVDWIDFVSDTGDSPLAAEVDFHDTDAVNLTTVHSAKGLEFDTVFIPALVSRRFPSPDRSEALPVPDDLVKEILPQGDSHIQEERRLFYVAMTRAKNRLYLIAADFYGQDRRPRKISQFVTETLGNAPALSSKPSSFLRQSPPPTTNHDPLPAINADYLDYSRIQTFKDCPLHYRAKYLLNLGVPPAAASTFGNVIHKTLKDYYENLKRGQMVDILKLLDANWDPAGYEDSRRQKLYHQKGVAMLTNFVSSLKPHPLLPEKLEEPFKFPLTPGLTIGGKMDRVNLLPDGRLEIVDYKTSAAKNQLDANGAQADLQLSIYALAATRLPYPPFNRQPEEVILTLHYLETGTLIQSSRTAAQLETAVENILATKTDIQHSDFACSHPYICTQSKCDYHLLCRVS